MGQIEAGSGTRRPLGGDPVSRERFSATTSAPSDPSWVIETEVNPFHCLYQDALFFHTQSRLTRAKSDAESARYARASLLAYLAAAEALIHQAAVELARPELALFVANPRRPLPLDEVIRLLPAIIDEGSPSALGQLELPPWPQFAELLALRTRWIYPGQASARKAYYRAPSRTADYEPLSADQAPTALGLSADKIQFPRTGLPLDIYALRPEHLDTARSVLDAAIESLDRCLGGALTDGNRHRKEPVRVVHPPDAELG